jgi:hypothetical protein
VVSLTMRPQTWRLSIMASMEVLAIIIVGAVQASHQAADDPVKAHYRSGALLSAGHSKLSALTSTATSRRQLRLFSTVSFLGQGGTDSVALEGYNLEAIDASNAKGVPVTNPPRPFNSPTGPMGLENSIT